MEIVMGILASVLVGQLLTPLAPAPAIPATTPGTVFPKGRDKNCPDGTALNPKLGRCLPTREGRTLLKEESLDDRAVNNTPPIPPTIAKEPNAQQLVKEATESCSAYPGSVPTPLPGGYACLPQK